MGVEEAHTHTGNSQECPFQCPSDEWSAENVP